MRISARASLKVIGTPGLGLKRGRMRRTVSFAAQTGILVAVCVALMAVIASVSGVNVAQQEFAVAFGTSQSTALWIINLYTSTLAALLLPLGAVGDRVGRRPVLLTGLVLFGLASAAAGLATSSGVMIGARLLAGVAAAASCR